MQSKEQMILCACGCGQELSKTDKYGRPHRFIPGHNMKTVKMRQSLKNNSRCLGFKHSIESRKKMSATRIGTHPSKATLQKMSEAKRGKYTGINHPMYGKHPSLESRKKMSITHIGITQSEDTIIKRIKVGKDHYNWQGGITPETRRRVKGMFWKKIADQIRVRDNNICQVCGCIGGSKKLPVHHIIPFKKSKNNDSDNLITVCQSCHIKLDKEYIDTSVHSLSQYGTHGIVEL